MANDKNKKIESILGELLASLSESLLLRIKTGEASYQDFSNAIKLLHNNGITCEVKSGDPMDTLKELLNEPFDNDILVSPLGGEEERDNIKQ